MPRRIKASCKLYFTQLTPFDISVKNCSQLLTNALHKHSQSLLNVHVNMYTPHCQQQNGTTIGAWHPSPSCRQIHRVQIILLQLLSIHDGAVGMRYLDVMLPSAYGHHVKTGPDFRTITDVIKWLFVIYFWHNKAHGTYDTYIVRSHHKKLAFPPWNQQRGIVYKNSTGSSTCQRRLEKKRKRKEKFTLKNN